MPLGEKLFRYRASVLLALVLASIFWAYCATSAKIATRFVDFFPTNHHNIELYREFQSYGGAQTITWMIQVQDGDIFNYETLGKIQGLTRAVDLLPGVNHQQIFSLASHRVTFAEAVPDGLDSHAFMHPDIPQTDAEVELLRNRVSIHRDKLQHLISADNKSATVTAAFNEATLEYGQLLTEIQGLIAEFEDEKHTIAVAGEPIVRGYGYHYFPMILSILALTVLAMGVVLYLCLGQYTGWWVPIVPASLSLLWGIGFVGLAGLNFDPVMVVIVFLLVARNLSHSIQWTGRFRDEFERCGDSRAACIETNQRMFGPGLLAIGTDIGGIIFIAFGGIPLLRDIAIAGSVWIAASLLMVFLLQAVMTSYLPDPRIRRREASATNPGRIERIWSWIAEIPGTDGPLRKLLLLGGALVVIGGITSGLQMDVGYSEPGTPLYRPGSKVNQDMRAIGKHFPIDEGWIVFTTPGFPHEQSALSPAVLRIADDLRNELLQDQSVIQVVSFASTIIKPFNQMFHYAHPKYYTLPETIEAAGNLWYLFVVGTAPGELELHFSSNAATDTIVRVLLRDHTADTLKRVQERITSFVETAKSETKYGNIDQVDIHYFAGIAGMYAAANDVMFKLDLMNITFVLGLVFIFCSISFRSFVAGILFVAASIVANFAAFIYLQWQGVGLTIDTVPVISLGIGLGVDYGIYIVERIRNEMELGGTIEEAVTRSLKTTGMAVLSTFAVMVGGIGGWAFSPVLFHAQMSILFIFLMGTNIIGGVLVLPAYIAWRKPKFIMAAARSESA